MNLFVSTEFGVTIKSSSFRTYLMQVDGPLTEDTSDGGLRMKSGPHSFSHGSPLHTRTSTCGSRHYTSLHPGAAPHIGSGGLMRRATRSGNGGSTQTATNYSGSVDPLWTCIYHLTPRAAQDGPTGGPARRGMYLGWIRAPCAQ
jgi:hypothetical protein